MRTQIHTDKNFRLTQILVLFSVFCLLFSLCGCEAFRKKFVRKSKRGKEVEVVIHPIEYESKYTIEEAYKKYFSFWRAWRDELVNSLDAQDANRKKQVFTAKRTLENLQQMRKLLLPEKQTRLDVFILGQKDIVRQLEGYSLSHIRKLRIIKNMLEKQRRQIQKEFKYKQIEKFLVKE